MPELPEIEVVKRSLLKTINKAKIIGVTIKNRNLRYKIPLKFSKKLVHQKILKVSRRSKYLIIYFNKKILLIHLGMSGKLLLLRTKDKKILKTSFYYDLNILPKHNHIFIYLSNGLVIIYNDIRRFGFFKLFNISKINEIPFFKKLGIEPFSKLFNEDYFKNFIKNKKKNIKNLLMDQKFVCGLGNIYVNEVLFMSKIHPLRPCDKLKKEELIILIKNIKIILKDSISKGGSSIRDFTNSYGSSGSFQQYFRVYGKDNKNCSRISCNGKIKKTVISNRSSFYCEKCQI